MGYSSYNLSGAAKIGEVYFTKEMKKLHQKTELFKSSFDKLGAISNFNHV